MRMVKFQNTDDAKCWQGCGNTRILIRCWWEANGTVTSGDNWWFLTELSILLQLCFSSCVPLYLPKCTENYTEINAHRCSEQFSL